jgi:phenylpropionate dioxygenase-like ring-hydroxylating dioxygenase large terminal subunit
MQIPADTHPPLDALIGSTRELKSSLANGYALPSPWYTDRALFAKERDSVLRKSWHYATHVGELAKVGDQFVCKIAGVPIVLTRDEQNEIRGFVNICRHRAHQVVLAKQNQRSMQCMYHGWTYGLDGCLRAAPRSKLEPGFDVNEFPLMPIQVALFGPTIWVNLDRQAPPFDKWTDGWSDLVKSHSLDLHSHRFGFEKRWIIKTNWKVFLDNAIECYHCPTCHPTLVRALEMDSRQHTLNIGGDYWISYTIPFRSAENGDWSGGPGGSPSESEARSDNRPLYHFHWIFPNTFFQYSTRGRGFDIGSVDVRDVDEIEFRNVFFFPTSMSDEEVTNLKTVYDQDPVVGEDVAICERVQVAHEAGLVPPGKLLMNSEAQLQHFQRVLVDMMERAR